MSEFEDVLGTDSQRIGNYNIEKIFIWNNEYRNEEIYEAAGAETLKAGTLLGRKSANGKLIKMASGAGDGSQTPVGILVRDYSVAGAGDVTVAIGISGNVDAGLLLFDGADDLDTVVAGKTYRDYLTQSGIIPVESDELTEYDNQ